MSKQIAVMWDGDTGEFVPLTTREDIQACIKAELPVVRWNGICYDQMSIDGEWVPVSDSDSAR